MANVKPCDAFACLLQTSDHELLLFCRESLRSIQPLLRRTADLGALHLTFGFVKGAPVALDDSKYYAINQVGNIYCFDRESVRLTVHN
jgi:hypothetical protein